MKSNKITLFVCAGLSVISGIGIVLIHIFLKSSDTAGILQGISSGIFTGFIVSLVIAIIGYFHERNVLLSKAEYNIKNLYINMKVLSQTIGNTVSQIHNSSSLEGLPFRTFIDLSKYNIEVFEKMDLGLFSPILKKGDLAQCYIALDQLYSNAYNISNISQSLLSQVLTYTYNTLKLQNIQIQGTQPSKEDLALLDDEKNAINIRTAKFHEYVTGKTMEIKKVACTFYNCTGKKDSWKTIQAELDKQAEEIMRM